MIPYSKQVSEYSIGKKYMYPLQNQLNVGYVGDMQRVKKKKKEKKSFCEIYDEEWGTIKIRIVTCLEVITQYNRQT